MDAHASRKTLAEKSISKLHLYRRFFFSKLVRICGAGLSLQSHSKSFLNSAKAVPKKILGTVYVLPILFVIGLALMLAVASILENVRFRQSVDQLLNIVDISRHYAAQEKSFATHPNEDLLGTLLLAGMMSISDGGMSVNASTSPATLTNPWQRKITVSSPQPSMMRIETSVPDHVCQRLALFLSKDAKGMGVLLMEARSGDQGIWRHFFDISRPVRPREADLDAACDLGNNMTLAVVLGVR